MDDNKNNKHTTPVIELSLQPYKVKKYRLQGEERFDELIHQGWQPLRGLLKFRQQKHENLVLHLPFMREMDDQIDYYRTEQMIEGRVLGIDLGLKTIATMSLMEHGVEIDRQFFDQKHMTGPADSWWKRGDRKYEMINFKRKITNLQRRADQMRAEMHEQRRIWRGVKREDGKSYSNSRAY